MLHTGIKGNRELTVTQELTAQAMGSGELPVFATPAVIALAEETAWRSVAPELEPGQGTVGTELQRDGTYRDRQKKADILRRGLR